MIQLFVLWVVSYETSITWILLLRQNFLRRVYCRRVRTKYYHNLSQTDTNSHKIWDMSLILSKCNHQKKIAEAHTVQIKVRFIHTHTRPHTHTDTHNRPQTTKLAFFSITLRGDLIHTSLRWFWSQPGRTEPAKSLFTFRSHGTHTHTHTSVLFLLLDMASGDQRHFLSFHTWSAFRIGSTRSCGAAC